MQTTTGTPRTPEETAAYMRNLNREMRQQKRDRRAARQTEAQAEYETTTAPKTTRTAVTFTRGEDRGGTYWVGERLTRDGRTYRVVRTQAEYIPYGESSARGARPTDEGGYLYIATAVADAN